jgi:hypothetical protein
LESLIVLYVEVAKNLEFHTLVVTRIGFEPMTYGLEGRCSIQLSYRAKLASLFWFPQVIEKGLSRQASQLNKNLAISALNENISHRR